MNFFGISYNFFAEMTKKNGVSWAKKNWSEFGKKKKIGVRSAIKIGMSWAKKHGVGLTKKNWSDLDKKNGVGKKKWNELDKKKLE